MIRLSPSGKIRAFSFISAVLCAVLAGSPAPAQQPANLSGTVTDISGAVISGASVLARSPSTNIQVQTATDGEGAFRFVQLASGDYVITATATGFSPAKANVTLVPETPPLHLILSIAAARETVEVNAGSVAIDTTSTTAGGSLDERAVEAVPLNGRSFTDTLAFEPGVIPASSAQSTAVVMAGVTSTLLRAISTPAIYP